MKATVIILAALFGGSLLAHWLLADPGYVLLQFQGYTIQTSVPVLLALLILVYLSIRVLIHLWRTPKKLGQMAAQRNARKSQERLANGLIDLAEGNWARSERMLSLGARKSERPFLNYLSAARAAQLQGHRERRDTWLKMAYEQSPKASAAVLLTQAELQIQDQDYEQALATLQKLDQTRPGHPQGLALQTRLYETLEDYEKLASLIPLLRKAKALSKSEIDTLQSKTALRRFAEAEQNKDLDVTKAVWNELSKQQQTEVQVLLAYAKALMACDEHNIAEVIVRKAVKSDWDEQLIRLYGDIKSTDVTKQLQNAETWLKQHGENPAILVTAARLCIQNELWGKARSYLESSLGLRPDPDSYQLYGLLLEHFGEGTEAADAFRSGLRLANKPLNLELPALSPPKE